MNIKYTFILPKKKKKKKKIIVGHCSQSVYFYLLNFFEGINKNKSGLFFNFIIDLVCGSANLFTNVKIKIDKLKIPDLSSLLW